MFEIGFLCPKSGKEMEKRTVNKTGFRAESNGLQAEHFLKWNCLLLLFFYFQVVANADNVDY